MNEGLAFDIYQRYRHVAQIIESLSCETGILKALDVGGQQQLLARFLPQTEIVVADLAPEANDNMVKAAGEALPFKEQSFDVVTAIDTLEHVPPESRTEFLEEAVRVAQRAVIVAVPNQSGEVEQAEELVRNYAYRLSKTPHDFLLQHKDHGLPSRKFFVDFAAQHHLNLRLLDNGYLPRWLLAMTISLGLRELLGGDALLATFSNLYNRLYYLKDLRAPAYRCLVVLSREPIPDLAQGQPESDPESELTAQAVAALMRDSAPIIEQQQQIVAYVRELEDGIATQSSLHEAAILKHTKHIVSLTKELEQTGEYCQALALQLKARDGAIESLREFVEKLETEIADRDHALAELEQQSVNLTTELTAHVNRNLELEQTYQSQMQELDKLTATLADASEHVKNMETALQAKNDEVVRGQQAYAKLETDYRLKQQDIEELGQRLQEVASRYDDLVAYVQHLEAQAVITQQLEAERQRLVEELGNYQVQYADAVAYVRRLEQVAADRAQHIVDLEGYTDHLQGEIVRLQQELGHE